MRRRSAGPVAVVSPLLRDPTAWRHLDAWREARASFDRDHGWPGGTLVPLQEQVAVVMLHEGVARDDGGAYDDDDDVEMFDVSADV